MPDLGAPHVASRAMAGGAATADEGAVAAVRRALCAGEVRLLGSLVLGGAVLFAAERVVLLAAFRANFADLAPATVLAALARGARVDLSFLGFLVLPVWFLCFVPRTHWGVSRGARRALVAWVCAWTFLLLLGVVCDVAHFAEFDARLNGTAIEYLNQPASLAVMLAKEFALVPVLLAVLAITVVAGRRLARTVARLAAQPSHGRARPVLAGGLLVVIGLSCRLPGAIDSWQGYAYFSDFYAANQLALNGPYNLGLALLDDAAGGAATFDRLEHVSEEDALATLLPRIVAPGDTPLGTPANPLWRRTDTARPARPLNVVLVLMEGFEARKIESLGGRRSHSPRFDALAAEGVLFTRLFASGSRTNCGLAGTLASLPATPGPSPLRSLTMQLGLHTIGDVLRARGYSTLALYGGAPTYDNLQALVLGNGFERLVARPDFERPHFATHWGVSDEDLYERAVAEFDDLAARGRPFLGFLLTLSNHRPYAFPEGRIRPVSERHPRAEVWNTFRYADWALGHFMDLARDRPWFDDTVFAFVADHGTHRLAVGGPDVGSFHIPFLLYAPRHLAPRRVDDVASQVDVAPTVMSVLGGAYEHGFFGSDLLGPSPPRRAMMRLDDEMLWLEGDDFVAWSPDGRMKLWHVGRRRPVPGGESPADLARRDALTLPLRAATRLAFTLPRAGRSRAPPR